MAQHYSNPSRESDPHALPDVETFHTEYLYCPECSSLILRDGNHATCEDCQTPIKNEWRYQRGWFYWFGFPGCLPDSEPFGPFETEELALADAREGCSDDDDVETNDEVL